MILFKLVDNSSNTKFKILDSTKFVRKQIEYLIRRTYIGYLGSKWKNIYKLYTLHIVQSESYRQFIFIRFIDTWNVSNLSNINPIDSILMCLLLFSGFVEATSFNYPQTCSCFVSFHVPVNSIMIRSFCGIVRAYCNFQFCYCKTYNFNICKWM